MPFARLCFDECIPRKLTSARWLCQAVGAMIWIEPESGVSLCVASPEPDMCYSEEFNLLSDKLREGIR